MYERRSEVAADIWRVLNGDIIKMLRPKTFEEKLEAYKTAAFNTFKNKPITHWILLEMLVAFPASSLLSRVYFSDGGKSKWIISASPLGSTSLILSTLFGYFTVKNKIINSIVVVTAAMVIKALDWIRIGMEA